jgi:probable rRNA maturation factor
MNIIISDENGYLDAETADRLRRAADLVLREEVCEDIDPLEVSVSVVSGDDIRELNAEFRGNDSVTDVLSFPQYETIDEIQEAIEDVTSEDDDDEPLPVPVGDVVLCYDRAAEQAADFGTGIEREVTYLFVHSMLHLLGYDHMDPAGKSLMRTREEDIMGKLGLSR